MKTVTGDVRYSVHVDCPHCKRILNLNDYPYTDEDSEFGHAEDLLGIEVFGSETDPARWSGFEIEYKCTGCKESFILKSLEM